MTDRVVGQWTRMALDASGDQRRVQGWRQLVFPAAVFGGPRQMIQHKLHDDRRRQRRGAQRFAVAPVQPRGPIGEGAAVATHRVRGSAGGDERRGRRLTGRIERG